MIVALYGGGLCGPFLSTNTNYYASSEASNSLQNPPFVIALLAFRAFFNSHICNIFKYFVLSLFELAFIFT
jgi:hypothetical protein